MVDRLSTGLMFRLLGNQITDNQTRVFNLSKQINSQKKFATSYDDPVALIGAIGVQGRILQNDQGIRNRIQSQTELDAAEVSINGMNNILGRVKEITLAAANDTLGPSERQNYADELKTLVQSFTQYVNNKVGDVYIFSGQQGDLQTIRLQDNAPYNTAVYKHNQDDTKQRVVDGVTTSIDLYNALTAQASSARLESTVINPMASSTGNLDFEINDGNNNITSFSANISNGDDLSTIITKINTAFTTAGGAGSIAHESPAGYLKMDTALITGSAASEDAKIQVMKSSDSTLANQLYIKKQINRGQEAGVYNTFQALDNALRSSDTTAIRGLITNLEFNLGQVNTALSKVGLAVGQIDRLNSSSDDLDIKLQADLSEAQDIDFVKANLDMTNAQAALQTSIQTSSNFFNQTLSRFLS
jgi:flagellar hook-associated protein 3